MRASETTVGRLSWCGNLLLVAAGVAGVSLIGRLDARDWQRDYDLLSFVEHANRIFEGAYLESPEAEQSRYDACVKKDASVAAAYAAAKERLVAWMLAGGVVTEAQAADMRSRTVISTGSAPFVRLTGYSMSPYDRVAAQGSPREDDTVDFFLGRFNVFAAPRYAEAVTAFKGELPDPRAPGRGRLARAYPSIDGYTFEFERSGDVGVEAVSIETDGVLSDELAAFAMFSREDFKSLYGSGDMLQRYGLEDSIDSIADQDGMLHTTYGHMPMQLAKEVASGGLLEGYGRLSIFGFDFSTKRFPLAVAVVSLALCMAVAFTVEVARREDVEGGATAGLLLGSRPGRALLWVLVPAGAVVLSLPFALVGPVEIGVTVVIGLVAALAGIVATGRAWRL